ncbi:hypothetical protein FVAG_03115 [Fusobacterium varium ATCC 27725]|jgi:hypothetical protein|nr:hypothetical protein FVAG_03115 [Fusobacterium varium ATCC 27725]VEH38217.1 Uncharacterised protein [Fusobacterium varium]
MFNRKDGNIKRIKIKLVILAVLVIIAFGMKYFK